MVGSPASLQAVGLNYDPAGERLETQPQRSLYVNRDRLRRGDMQNLSFAEFDES